MLKAYFQDQQENSNVNAVIEADLIRRHDSSFARLLVSENPQFLLIALHDPGLVLQALGANRAILAASR